MAESDILKAKLQASFRGGGNFERAGEKLRFKRNDENDRAHMGIAEALER